MLPRWYIAPLIHYANVGDVHNLCVARRLARAADPGQQFSLYRWHTSMSPVVIAPVVIARSGSDEAIPGSQPSRPYGFYRLTLRRLPRKPRPGGAKRVRSGAMMSSLSYAAPTSVDD